MEERSGTERQSEEWSYGSNSGVNNLCREVRNLVVDGQFNGMLQPTFSYEKRKRAKTKRFRPKQDAMESSYYDEDGKFLKNEIDLCDCLEVKCPGCFEVCKDCHGRKCSFECRAFRQSYIDSIENEGRETVLKLWFTPEVKKQCAGGNGKQK